jgi:lipopolysaccharide transport system ATP-binding protein
MSDIVIKAENISKLYKLGNVSAATFKEDANKLWAKVRGKEDPTLLLAEVNDRTKKGTSDYVWALKDINFQVNQGDVLGIIGRNGAGKSTLLKILSKVTASTTGSIKVKGRIASLLEVGTGFHPELTGNENIYLNGHILGMSKREIDRKFDEIIDFAGVEKYLNTPVKRYSSGMYVRLAFAVAAHLEPDILIVDEVLAVGDSEFQAKCLGKMNDVSRKDGRTILFVSHNMASIKALCRTGIYLQNGMVHSAGGINEILNSYKRSNAGVFQLDGFTQLAQRINRCASEGRVAGHLRFTALRILDKSHNVANTFHTEDEIFFEIEYEAFEDVENLRIAILIQSADTFNAVTSNSFVIDQNTISKGKKGKVLIHFFDLSLQDGDYLPYFWAGTLSTEPYDIIDRLIINVPIIEIIGAKNKSLPQLHSKVEVLF